MARERLLPHVLVAGADGQMYEESGLLMLARRGTEMGLPRPDELMELPAESELFLLPGRHALGLDPETGRTEALEESAVAAFVSPAHTLTGVAAYHTGANAPRLPLFAYGAVGAHEGRLYVCARRVDPDRRQVFANVAQKKIRKGAKRLMVAYPDNRLIQHLAGCALTNCCPAARNLALGRYEAPLPTARACNADCLGCLSWQPEGSGFPAVQNRIAFRPTAKEIAEVMWEHERSEPRPVLSFGQGCEGEPLTEANRIAEAVTLYRSKGGRGWVNVNTNASLPETVGPLAAAGVNAVRVSMASPEAGRYAAYHRPRGYAFADVLAFSRQASRAGVFVSLNLFFFPGVTDSEPEYAALGDFIADGGADFIQLRNMNLDPELYLELLASSGGAPGPAMGFGNFLKRLGKDFPRVGTGYFNPYVAEGKVLPYGV